MYSIQKTIWQWLALVMITMASCTINQKNTKQEGSKASVVIDSAIYQEGVERAVEEKLHQKYK